MAGPKPLSDDDLQKEISARVSDAILFAEEEVGTDREKFTRYYRGDVSQDLKDIAGRSRVVSRDLRDVVLQILPSIMRVYFGSRNVIGCDPTGPEDEEAAKQGTDYVNYILSHDNDGPSIFYSVFKDALVRRTGIAKVYWCDLTEVAAERFSGIAPDVFEVFQAEAAQSAQVQEITDVTQDDNGNFGFIVKTKKRKGRVKVDALPPEEFIISRDAKDSVRPSLIGHRTLLTVSDLVAMGYDYDEMVDLAGSREDLDTTGEEDARRFNSDVFDEEDGATTPSLRKVEYFELYALIDADGDGIAEMRKICCAGPERKVLANEVVSDHPFADFCPEPEPHTFYGLGMGDCLDDIQLIRTQLMRLMLDALSSVVTPRQKYLRGKVDMKQLQDARPGGLVGVDQMDAVMPLDTDKAAPALAMQAYELMATVRQDRTGQNQASMGLSPDALQSVSRIASNELVQNAQARVGMICQHFARGMRRVARLTLSLITRHQDYERTVRLRGKWIPMDPRTWNPDMDVSVNVGLGKGNVEENTAFLQSFLQIQNLIMEKAGPDNPWVDAEKVRNTLEDVCETAGKMAERYVLTQEEWQAKMQQKAQQPPDPPKPDPAELLAKVEADKIQASIVRDDKKTQFEAQRELLKDDRDRDATEAKIIMDCLAKGIDPQLVLAHMRQARMATPSQVMQ